MSKRNLGDKIKLASYDDMFGTMDDPAGPAAPDGQVKDVALSELHPFRNHPFKV